MALEGWGRRDDDSAMPRDSREPATVGWLPASMAPAVAARLAELGEPRDFPAGTVVIREGGPCDSLGVITRGRIALRMQVPGGPDRTLITADEGDLYGWSALLSDATATASGVAVVDSQALVFERARLLDAMAADCVLASAVQAWVLAAVARRLQATRLQLLDLYRSGLEP